LSNHLAGAISPYLLQHAENPVDWFPWSDEALARARLEDKPIFLSIGYAACHWCHVMAHESFEDPETASILNQHFVNIKVDREERPDLDSIYMSAVVAMTGQGGWPMSVFLTPDGRPFFGGTYFPPIPRHGLPAFKQVLQGVAQAWEKERNQVVDVGDRLANRLRATRFASRDSSDLDLATLDRAAERLFNGYDWEHGGWGGAPKFPQPQAIEFLFRRFARRGDKLARDQALHALQHMSWGGIYDHLGGGFARYAVDAGWIIPHFEKMLYDNALLIPAYLHAWQISGSRDYLAIARETVGFALRELRLAEGGFASSLDADSEGEEGRFYAWELDQVEAAIADPLHRQIFNHAYGLNAAPNFDGRFVLNQTMSDEALANEFRITPSVLSESLGTARRQALEYRARRVRPGRDDKVLAGWNGLMLLALAEYARATGDAAASQAGAELADFLDRNLREGPMVRRAWRAGRLSEVGYLEDHAGLGLGWLAQYQVDFDLRWYRLGRAEAEIILGEFTDPAGGFFDTPDSSALGLLFRPKTVEDNPTPSGTAMAIQLLLKVGTLSGEGRFIEPAEAALKPLQSSLDKYPTAFAGGLAALDLALGPRLQLAYVGEADLNSLRQIADQRYLPNLVSAGSPQGLAEEPELLRGRTPLDGRATAYLCHEFTCRLPTSDPLVLTHQIDEAIGA
jgi:uncharacterized protein YyaL (SSP411 family)